MKSKSEYITMSRQLFFELAYQYTFSIHRKILLIFLFLLFLVFVYKSLELLMLVVGFLFFTDWVTHRLGMKERYRKELPIKRQIEEDGVLSQNTRIINPNAEQEHDKIGAGVSWHLIERKKSLIENMLSGLDNSMVLDVGCGITTGQMLANSSEKKYVGADIILDYLKEIRMKIGVDVVLCDAHYPPFKKEVFSLVNFTDVIEHLHNPALGLQELHKSLKNGGRLILTTENRAMFTADCFNPLVFIERAIGNYIPAVLPPSSLVDQWPGCTPFYHIEFSKKEIVGLMENTGFKIDRYQSFNQLSWIIQTALLMGINTKNLARFVYGLENLMIKLPVLKNMGHFVLVCKKA